MTTTPAANHAEGWTSRPTGRRPGTLLAPWAPDQSDALSPIAEEEPPFALLAVPVGPSEKPVAEPLPPPRLPARRRVWPQALALSVGAAATQRLILRAPKTASLLMQPFGAICCWGASASLIMGGRIQSRQGPRGPVYFAAQNVGHVASLAFWTLPLLIRSDAPLGGSAIGLQLALGIGSVIALGLWAGRSCLERQQESRRHDVREPTPRIDHLARLAGSFAFILSTRDHSAGLTLVTLGATLAGMYEGLRDAGHPDAQAPLASRGVADEPCAWRQGRDQAITASELAVRIALALRLIGALVPLNG